jgi:hypothetical protein
MSVIPGTYNFRDHYKGSTFSPLHIKFNFNLTGSTIICQIKHLPTSAILHEWRTGVNISVLDLPTGEIILNQINKFSPQIGNHVYDLQIDFGDGTSQTYMEGSVKVHQDVTVPII